MDTYFSAKKIHLLTLFIILIALNSYSQCTEIATNFGNNTATPSYNITGDVSITINTDSTVTLDLASNFSTASGPDVRAYLVNSNGMSDTAIKNAVITDLDNIEFGLIAAAGAQALTIAVPDGKDITTFDKIFFYCLNFNTFWDIGTFTPFDATSCTVLGIEGNTISTVGMYPNPATTTLELRNIDLLNTEIRIFELSGKRVFQQLKGNAQNIIDISNLKSGIYVVSVRENNQQFSEKLVIQ